MNRAINSCKNNKVEGQSSKPIFCGNIYLNNVGEFGHTSMHAVG